MMLRKSDERALSFDRRQQKTKKNQVMRGTTCCGSCFLYDSVSTRQRTNTRSRSEACIHLELRRYYIERAVNKVSRIVCRTST